MSQYQAIINSPLGKLGIKTYDNCLIAIQFLARSTALLNPQNDIAKLCVTQLEQYFNSAQFSFNLPLQLNVSSYQQKVLQALQKIPSGSTQTYGEIACTLKSGPRAVGMACRSNPIPIIIPCHRVVAAKHLGGYSGATQGELMDIKRWLLQHENRAS